MVFSSNLGYYSSLIYISLPKASSSYTLSPQRGERVRMGGEEKTFGNEYISKILARRGGSRTAPTNRTKAGAPDPGSLF
jgi:hypothetical protein